MYDYIAIRGVITRNLVTRDRITAFGYFIGLFGIIDIFPEKKRNICINYIRSCIWILFFFFRYRLV